MRYQLLGSLPWLLLAVACWAHVFDLPLGPAHALLGLLALVGLVASLGWSRLRQRRRPWPVDSVPSPLALAAHELRSPLTALRSYAELLQREPPTLPPAVRGDCLASIVRLCDRMADICRALLDAERVSQGRLALTRVAFRPAEPAHRALETARLSCPRHHFQAVLDSDLPPTWGDPARVEDVLANLLTNAAKFSPPESEVRLELRPAPEGVCVRVIDQGPGLSDAVQGSLFQPFVQAGPGLNHKGYGLGLYIARRYVEAMGGHLWAEAQPSGGTAFCFTLPRAATQLAHLPVPAPAMR